MRVLVVARSKNGRFAPFITEQVQALMDKGVDCRFFPIVDGGVSGYIKNWKEFMRSIKEYRPQVIHAHYGLCGLYANVQRKIPVVTTYHGSDINDPKVRIFSKVSVRLSRFNVFVSRNNIDLIRPKQRFQLIPCGVDLSEFPIVKKEDARKELGLSLDQKYCLFAGAFDNAVKNASLAREAVALLPTIKLLELKGFSRSQVCMLMQAVDVLLLTSHMEGSPQVIKEAMVCGCPIVSVDVGDVKERIDGLAGCYIAQRDAVDVADKIDLAVSFKGRTKGREAILKSRMTNDLIAKRIIEVYNSIMQEP